jgi:hypothetical protein
MMPIATFSVARAFYFGGLARCKRISTTPTVSCPHRLATTRTDRALAFLNSAGVYQMVGYTVPTWYGYGGWGMLDYFLEQPGRFTLSEAFFANQQAFIHRLVTSFPEAAATTTAGRLPRDKELPPSAPRP